MKAIKGATYIQPDARGRIQLPKHLRSYPLFKLQEKGARVELIPLRVEEEPEAPASELWLQENVEKFLLANLFPELNTLFSEEAIPEALSAFLYGSRARGDALSGSDFDFGVLCKKIPSSSRRNEICDQLLAKIAPGFETLKAHGVKGEPSFHFFSIEVPKEEIPPIYFSIASDGKPIWDRASYWKNFLRQMESLQKKFKVVSEGSGRTRRWKWKKPN